MSVVTVVGGATFALLDSVKNCEFSVQNESADGASIKILDQSPTFLKRRCTLSASTMSGSSLRVTNIDVTGLLMNSVEYSADLLSGSMTIQMSHKDGDAAEDFDAQPNVVGRVISGEVALAIPTSAYHAVATRALSTTIANLEFTLSLTLGGTTITLPVYSNSWTHVANYGDIQQVRFQYTGKAPYDGSTYLSSAPSASTSVLGCALSDPRALLTYVFQTAASGGAGKRFSGSCVIDSVRFSWNQNSVVMTEYSFKSHGATTVGSPS